MVQAAGGARRGGDDPPASWRGASPASFRGSPVDAQPGDRVECLVGGQAVLAMVESRQGNRLQVVLDSTGGAATVAVADVLRARVGTVDDQLNHASRRLSRRTEKTLDLDAERSLRRDHDIFDIVHERENSRTQEDSEGLLA